MKNASVEIFVDARPVRLPFSIVRASSLPTIAARALRSVKLKRGVQQITIRLRVIPNPSPSKRNEGEFVVESYKLNAP